MRWRVRIGVPTGYASGWLVMDVDPRAEGDASLSELIEEYGSIPPTLEQKTGGNGHHIILEYPELAQLGNSRGKLPKGIDIRGDGGYVIVAPSLHASGERYIWRNDLDPAPVPDWLMNFLTDNKDVLSASGKKPSLQPKCVAEIEGIITEGGRNEALFRIACAMRGAGAEYAEIEAHLIQLNTNRCVPPLTDSEIQKIAKSAARYAPNGQAVGV